MLFSEPKIPQTTAPSHSCGYRWFQCSSASRKFLNWIPRPFVRVNKQFQCSSASRKFLNCTCRQLVSRWQSVSVLFSEPKIPQWTFSRSRWSGTTRFSALQRAENSSTQERPNRNIRHRQRFSALQRAENSSTQRFGWWAARSPGFQCSSASRKFLNPNSTKHTRCHAPVSVLFSEPKIPQPAAPERRERRRFPFQCSSASRKFLNRRGAPGRVRVCDVFQCSSASRKFLNDVSADAGRGIRYTFQCSSASRKFLNSSPSPPPRPPARRFSALQRAENSSTVLVPPDQL